MILAIIMGVFASVLAVELLGVSRWLAYKLILRAVEFLPELEREQYQKVWFAELEQIHRFGFSSPQLWFAISTYFGAPKLGMVLRNMIEFDAKFGFFKFARYLLIFNVLRVLESLTFLLVKKVKNKAKKEKAAELFIKARSYKFLVRLIIVVSAPPWVAVIAPHWIKIHIEKLLRNHRTSNEVV